MNFCFVIDNKLSASSQPGKNKRLAYYLDLFKENDVKVLLSTYKKVNLPEEYVKDFKTYFFPLSEFENPTISQLDEIVNTIIRHIKKNEAVNVNCAAGISNSNMVLIAVVMKFRELGVHEAAEYVGQFRGTLHEPEKISLLRDYERFLEARKAV
jgi:protein-tyrosine phosphatase